MKIVAVNGGPRKNCNTAQLLDSFLNGVREAVPDAEIDILYYYLRDLRVLLLMDHRIYTDWLKPDTMCRFL